ncbi:hypothetical protein ACHAWF_007926 [Thalassiosira exigua]
MTRHRSSPTAKLAVRVRKRARTMLKSIVSLEFLQDIMHLDDLQEDALDESFLKYFDKKKISKQRKDSASNRKFRQRRSWAQFQESLTERQFRRYFRMSRECFNYLCMRITDNVGEREFKSEDFLKNMKFCDEFTDAKTKSLMTAHEKTTGGFISGEVKLALTLRLLAGGSYLDLSLLYEVGPSYAYDIFKDVLKNWILDDKLVKISGTDYVNDEERLAQVALEFSRASRGFFNGCIGAIDGWIVKIRKPNINDNVTNPGSFFSRKGYFGLNVVAIVDRKKRVLYRVIKSRGAEHDSTAFKHSNLYKWLIDNWKWLKLRGYYFLGDSAYNLKSFLLTPYDNALHGDPEDSYNFFHSSQRICVECAFGEIDLRWGILWRPLHFSLKWNCRIIDACMRLHNFIVDFREEFEPTSYSAISFDREIFTEDSRRFLAGQQGVGSWGVNGGEEELRRDAEGNPLLGGRPSNAEVLTSAEGRACRNMIRDYIESQGGERPAANWFRSQNRTLDNI